MQRKLKIAVIGVGTIGALHARIINENPNAELVSIADLNTELCENISKLYSCNAYHDYRKMLDKEELDAVDICVPEEYHVETAIAVAKAKKDIILEKPIAKNVVDAIAIKNACDKNGVRLMIAHVLKFDPRYVQLKDAILRGELGEVSSLSLKRIAPIDTPKRLNGKVSIFHYMGVHDIEWMLDYAENAKPIKVYAQMVSKKNVIYNECDTVFAIITFDNGIIGNLELSWALPENFSVGLVTGVEIIGTKGSGILEIKGEELKITSETGLAYSPDTLHWPCYNGNIFGDLKEEINHFILATLNKEPYIVDCERAINAIKVIEACCKSLESGLPQSIKQ